jgi:hypothetical protein
MKGADQNSARVFGRLKWEKWGVAGLFLTALILSAGYAYYSIFSQFAVWDDEGFILISLKSFFQGKPLYDQVYSCYQPWFYAFNWLAFHLSGMPVTHDSIRFLTIALWLTVTLLNAVFIYRLTASSILALMVLVLSVRSFGAFANEPGHPQSLAYLLTISVLTLFTFSRRPSQHKLLFVVGSLAGLLVLTKINVGLYLLLPVTLVISANSNGALAVWLKAAIGGAMLVLPMALMRPWLVASGWFITCLVVSVLLAILMVTTLWMRQCKLSMIALFALFCCADALMLSVASANNPVPIFNAWLLTLSIGGAVMIALAHPTDITFERPAWWFGVIGGMAAMGAVAIALLGHGTSIHGLMNGIFWLPAKQSGSFCSPWNSNPMNIWLAMAGIAGCCAYVWWRERWGKEERFHRSILIFKLLFGLAVLAEFIFQKAQPLPHEPVLDSLPHFWMLPFVWLVAIPPRSGTTGSLPRLVLMTVAVMQPLIAYPIAGSQLVPATILMLLAATICLYDALQDLSSLTSMRYLSPLVRVAVGTVAGLCLLLWLGIETKVRQRLYASLTPLELPGASHMRLNQSQVNLYQELVRPLARPEVGTFLTLPGLNSLYFWAQKEPPTDFNVTVWMTLLDEPCQEKIWQAAQSHPGLMVVRNQQLAAWWMQGRPFNQYALVHHIEDNFKTLSSRDGFELMIRR